jgi:hypothetical protein
MRWMIIGMVWFFFFGASANNLESRFAKLYTSNVTVTPDKDDMVRTDFDYYLHQSCLELRPDSEMVTLLKESIIEGLNCLENLGDSTKKRIDLFERHLTLKPELYCQANMATDYEKSQMGGFANTYKKRVTPYISVNPRFAREGSPAEVKSILFHEMIHNIGYDHTWTIEYAYTCDECCFPGENSTLKEIELACKICAMEDSTIDDREYLIDLMAFSVMGQWGNGVRRAMIYAFTHEHEVFAKELVVRSTYSYFARPFAIALAIRVLQSETTLSNSEKDYLEKVAGKTISDYWAIDVLVVQQIALLLADAFLYSYNANYDSAHLNLLKFHTQIDEYAAEALGPYENSLLVIEDRMLRTLRLGLWHKLKNPPKKGKRKHKRLYRERLNSANKLFKLI